MEKEKVVEQSTDAADKEITESNIKKSVLDSATIVGGVAGADYLLKEIGQVVKEFHDVNKIIQGSDPKKRTDIKIRRKILYKPPPNRIHSEKGWFSGWSNDEINQAILDYSLEVKLNPDDLEIYLDRGAAYVAAGSYEKALTDLSHVIRNTKETWQIIDAYLWAGICSSIMGDENTAIDIYKKGIQYGDDAFLLCRLGYSYFKIFETQKAIFYFNKAIEIEPNFISARLYRARSLMKLKLYNKARQDLNKILSIDPDNTWAKSELTTVKRLLKHDNYTDNDK